MSDLSVRLLAALDERDQLAQNATPGPWEATANRRVLGPGPRIPSMCVDSPVAESHSGNADWIAANDPSSWLRMSAAWREIVELHQGGHECACHAPDGSTDWRYFYADDKDPCPTLSAVAEALGVEP